MIYLIFFLVFVSFFCFSVISSRNPVHSVLSLVCVFLLSSGLLVCLEVEFLALSFVIIYVGAIAIFFLFVVMMLDIKVVDSSFNFLQQSFFAYFGCSFFFLLMIFPISQSIFSINQSTGLSFYFIDWFSENSSFSNLVSLGLLLYTHYFIFFLIAGFILLIAVFGVLMLLLSLNKNSPSANFSALSKKQSVKKMFKLNVFSNF